MAFLSNQRNARFFTFTAHLVGPDAGLNLADMRLAQIKHTKARLSDAATDAQRQRALNQTAVEIKLQAIFLAALLKLAEQSLFVILANRPR